MVGRGAEDATYVTKLTTLDILQQPEQLPLVKWDYLAENMFHIWEELLFTYKLASNLPTVIDAACTHLH